MMAKRNIFAELMEGVSEMKRHREGKLTLRSYKVGLPATQGRFKVIRDTRKKLRCSRAVFAWKLRINERTLESGSRAAPNPIRRRQRWCCWYGAIPIHWRGWMRSRKGSNRVIRLPLQAARIR